VTKEISVNDMKHPRSDVRSAWNDVRRMADEVELQIHLARMDARDTWRELQPRLTEVEETIARSSQRLDAAISDKVTKLGAALRKLREDLAKS
jgi:hypothetical protein